MCLLRTWTPTPAVGIILQPHNVKQTHILTSRARTYNTEWVCSGLDGLRCENSGEEGIFIITHVHTQELSYPACVWVEAEVTKWELRLAELRLNIVAPSVCYTYKMAHRGITYYILLFYVIFFSLNLDRKGKWYVVLYMTFVLWLVWKTNTVYYHIKCNITQDIKALIVTQM